MDTTLNTLTRTAGDINRAMTRVYSHMTLAVLTSMIVSYLISTSAALMSTLFTGIMAYVVLFLPLLFIFIVVPIMSNIDTPPAGRAALLHLFAAVMGLSFAPIFLVYTGGSIFTAFMGAAVLFATMTGYGYFTKQSLESVGQFCFVGLIAIIIASLINIFVGSSIMAMVISAIAIVIFLGLTAYDTQTIREQLMDGDDDSAEIMGALTLYLDFINIFINLLQLIGVAPGKDD